VGPHALPHSHTCLAYLHSSIRTSHPLINQSTPKEPYLDLPSHLDLPHTHMGMPASCPGSSCGTCRSAVVRSLGEACNAVNKPNNKAVKDVMVGGYAKLASILEGAVDKMVQVRAEEGRQWGVRLVKVHREAGGNGHGSLMNGWDILDACF
jgi:hypothetical protein